MGLISIIKQSKELRSANIVILGASGAGKTTFVRFTQTKKPVEDDPRITRGIDVRSRSIKVDGWALTTIDIGGQQLYQKMYWNLGMNQAQAVVYMIDGTIRPKNLDDTFEMSLFSFEYMLELLPPSRPILILINKQDLREQNPLSVAEATELYPITNLAGRSINILPTSAKYGIGVKISLKWLASKIMTH